MIDKRCVLLILDVRWRGKMATDSRQKTAYVRDDVRSLPWDVGYAYMSMTLDSSGEKNITLNSCLSYF